MSASVEAVQARLAALGCPHAGQLTKDLLSHEGGAVRLRIAEWLAREVDTGTVPGTDAIEDDAIPARVLRLASLSTALGLATSNEANDLVFGSLSAARQARYFSDFTALVEDMRPFQAAAAAAAAEAAATGSEAVPPQESSEADGGDGAATASGGPDPLVAVLNAQVGRDVGFAHAVLSAGLGKTIGGAYGRGAGSKRRGAEDTADAGDGPSARGLLEAHEDLLVEATATLDGLRRAVNDLIAAGGDYELEPDDVAAHGTHLQESLDTLLSLVDGFGQVYEAKFRPWVEVSDRPPASGVGPAAASLAQALYPVEAALRAVAAIRESCLEIAEGVRAVLDPVAETAGGGRPLGVETLTDLRRAVDVFEAAVSRMERR